MTRRRFFGWPQLRWNIWLVLSLIFLATSILSAIGEYLGWWRDLGGVISLVSLALSVWTVITGMTEAAVEPIHEKLDSILDKVDTLGVVLERMEQVLLRIERLLDERLPPASLGRR